MEAQRLTILDGGMGRELKRIGAPFSQPNWSAQALIEAPELVRQAHQNFVDAGARVITVNSYACVPFHLGDDLYQLRGSELATTAARIAREVADAASTRVLVAGCIPPVLGSYRTDLFSTEHAYPLWKSLVGAQVDVVDVWFAETISSIQEALGIVDVLADTKKPIYVSFTIEDTFEGPARLRSGELVSEAVSALIKVPIAGILFNCSIPEAITQAIIATKQVFESKGLAHLSIGGQANSFAPIFSAHSANQTMQEMRHFSPEAYLAFAKRWVTEGATMIGGCCGIDPRHISTLSTHFIDQC